MSLRKAINQMCKSCIHDPLSAGTWRQQVCLCSVKSCPLWELRAKPTRPIPFSESLLSIGPKMMNLSLRMVRNGREPKTPAYQEYASTMLADISFRSMNLEERGLLYTLRLECWANGSLPSDITTLSIVLGQNIKPEHI